jgi:hypothetical protein
VSLNNIHCKQKFIGEEPQHPFSKIDFFSFPKIEFFSQFFPDFLPIFVIEKYEKISYDVGLYVCSAHNGNGG